MRSAMALAAGVFTLTLVLVLPASAQDFKPPANLLGQAKPALKPPKVDWNWRPSAERAQAGRPFIVCGMTVIPADPKIDPRMALKPTDAGTKYTLTIVEPTVCKAP